MSAQGLCSGPENRVTVGVAQTDPSETSGVPSLHRSPTEVLFPCTSRVLQERSRFGWIGGPEEGRGTGGRRPGVGDRWSELGRVGLEGFSGLVEF